MANNRLLLVALLCAFALSIGIAYAEPSEDTEKKKKDFWEEMLNRPIPTCAKEDLQPWPLPSMSQNEKKTRLQWFSSREGLKLFFSGGGFDEDKCHQFLDRIKTLDGIKVLQPTYHSPLPNPDIAKRIAPACPNLEVEREYNIFSAEESRLSKERHREENETYPLMHRHFSSYTRDALFLNLPRAEKESIGHVYVEAAKTTEYYDLSKYLGEGVWAYFAEAAHYYRKDRNTNEFKLVTNDQCFPQFYAIQKFFDTRSCETAYDPYEPVLRLSNVTYGGESLHGRFPNANFTALVEYQNNVYRLSVNRSDILHSIMPFISKKPYAYPLYIDRISKDSNKLNVQSVCSFDYFLRKPSGKNIR